MSRRISCPIPQRGFPVADVPIFSALRAPPDDSVCIRLKIGFDPSRTRLSPRTATAPYPLVRLPLRRKTSRVCNDRPQVLREVPRRRRHRRDRTILRQEMRQIRNERSRHRCVPIFLFSRDKISANVYSALDIMASLQPEACHPSIVDCVASHTEPHVEPEGVNLITEAGHG